MTCRPTFYLATQMLASLDRLAALPDDTRIACAHRYTEANTAFANAVEPGNPDITARQQRTRQIRQDGKAQPAGPASTSEEPDQSIFAYPPACRAASGHPSCRPAPVADDVGLLPPCAYRNISVSIKMSVCR